MCQVEMKDSSGNRALERLVAGNRRYLTSKQKRPNQTSERRAELKDGQDPFAVILGCSDSRVSPEIIFDQGLGDLFIVRVAGNVVDDIVLGSIVYAVSHLKTPLVVVLGHSHCGAVSATLSTHGPFAGRLGCVTEAIRPAVDRVRDQPGDLLNSAAKTHAKMIADRLRETGPLLSDAVGAGHLVIVAAYYDLNTGVVDILSQ